MPYRKRRARKASKLRVSVTNSKFVPAVKTGKIPEWMGLRPKNWWNEKPRPIQGVWDEESGQTFESRRRQITCKIKRLTKKHDDIMMMLLLFDPTEKSTQDMMLNVGRRADAIRKEIESLKAEHSSLYKPLWSQLSDVHK